MKKWFKSFNPSVEGKPLQLCQSRSLEVPRTCFNPSVEGKPLQLVESFELPVFAQTSFNPSVEGKPLQRAAVQKVLKTINEFQSLCRGEASATYLTLVFLQWLIEVSIPLSRGSLCNRQSRMVPLLRVKMFQSLCRGEASATLILYLKETHLD